MVDRTELVGNAVAGIVRRLVKLMLSEGLAYQAFDDILRKAYVQVAETDFQLDDRRMSASRIATLTGLHRKEVARLRAGEDSSATQREEAGRTRASQVVAGWLRDSHFHDRKGDPLPLPFDGEASVSELVRRYGRDITPRSVVDELMRLDVVEQAGELYRLTSRSTDPPPGFDEQIELIGRDTSDFLETLLFNLERDSDEASRLQRKAVYDNVPEEYVDAFQRLSTRMAENLLQELDIWLAAHDRDNVPGLLGRGRVRLGLGVHHIFERLDDAE